MTTLDILSGGRAWLGIGAGHYEGGVRGASESLPALGDRYELLEDALEVCSRLCGPARGGAFAGHHVAAGRLLNLLALPDPHLLSPGTASGVPCPLVARYADACSLRPDARHPPQARRPAPPLRHGGHRLRPDRAHLAFAFTADDGGPATRGLIGQLRGWPDWGSTP